MFYLGPFLPFFYIFNFYSFPYNSLYKMLHRQKVFLKLGLSFEICIDYMLKKKSTVEELLSLRTEVDLIWK